MSKKLIGLTLAIVMCTVAAFPAFADTKAWIYIESTSIDLQYTDFQAGSTDDDSAVKVTLNDTGGLYELEKTGMDVPANGWAAGDVPDLRVTLVVKNEDTTKFAHSASRPSGVSVSGGDAHYGELRSNSKRVYYEIHLNQVQENDEKWDDERDGGSPQPGGPGASTKGAWLKDPNNGRYWYSNSNGTRTVNNWQKIDGIWYFFDATGFRVENQWIKWKDKSYYLGANGRMYANERTPDGYWVDKDGAWDGKPKK